MTEGTLKVSKLTQRLQIAQKEKRFYEAHQLYKTIYFRCSVRKNYTEAYQFLIPGSIFLLENQQWASGIDLACLAIDVLQLSTITITEQHLSDICRLLKLMPSSCIDREKYLSKTLKLLTGNQLLLDAFNEYFGRQMWEEGSLIPARNRIMLSGNGFIVGCFLIEMHQRFGAKSEIDLFITQAVLQFLCLKKATVAAVTFFTYTRRHPKIEPGPPFAHYPLLNFVWLLMMAIDRKLDLSALSTLCMHYRPQLNRDPSYALYLEKVSQLYFGVKPQQNPLCGLLSNLAKMLGDGFENDSSDEDMASPSTSYSMQVDDID